MIKNVAKKTLVALSANGFVQKLLEKNVAVSQFLMGIAAGSAPESSGEEAILSALKATEADGPLCIFDVGANQGQFLTLVERVLSGTSFLVHAFEPNAHSFESLRRVTSGFSNVKLNNCALGNEVGTAQLYFDAPGSGLASLSKRRLDHFGIPFHLSESITIDTVDRYCERNSIAAIDLLKLDVEGHELDVLRGATRMLSSGNVAMISFEFGGCNIDSRTYFQDFFYFFREHGMNNIHRITPSGFLVPLHGYRELYEQFRTTNFLVTR